MTIQHGRKVSGSIPYERTWYFHISAVQHMHISDGEDFGTVPSLVGFVSVEQKLCHKSKGLRICLDLGRIKEVNFFCCFTLHLRCLIYKT